jgi:hypothetical protein
MGMWFPCSSLLDAKPVSCVTGQRKVAINTKNLFKKYQKSEEWK